MKTKRIEIKYVILYLNFLNWVIKNIINGIIIKIVFTIKLNRINVGITRSVTATKNNFLDSCSKNFINIRYPLIKKSTAGVSGM